MKKTRLLLFCLLIASLAVATACGGNPVKKDLESYFKDAFPAIKQLDEDIVISYGKVVGEDFRQNTLFEDALRDELIPAVEDFLDYIHSVTPATQDVQDAHAKIADGIERQYEAYSIMLGAIASKNYDRINDANAKLRDAAVDKTAYINALKALADEHGVDLPGGSSAPDPGEVDPGGEEPIDVPPTGDQKPLVFPLVDAHTGYVEATLGEFSEFLDRMFSYYDTDYPESDMIRFFGAGHDGYGYALDVRYETAGDGEESGGEETITLFEIVSMVVSEVPESGGFLFSPEETLEYLYDNFAQ